MGVSRTSLAARFAVVAVAAAGTGGIVVPAYAAGASPEFRVAQNAAPPVRLGPRNPPPSTGPAKSSQPAAETPLPSTGPAPLILPKVEIQPLSAPDPDSVGVLDDPQGGLGIDMWHDTDRATVATLMPLLPHRAGSPTVRDLMRRLLLTRATAPRALAPNQKSAAASSNAKTDSPDLLGLRIEALFAIGDLDGALKLFRLVDPDRAGKQLVRAEAEPQVFSNDTAAACKKVRDRAQSFTRTDSLPSTASRRRPPRCAARPPRTPAARRAALRRRPPPPAAHRRAGYPRGGAQPPPRPPAGGNARPKRFLNREHTGQRNAARPSRPESPHPGTPPPGLRRQGQPE